MMRTLWQMAAVVRTELRFGLRRGFPVIGTAAVGLVVSAGTLYLVFMNMEGMPRDYAAKAGAGALAMAWPAFQWLALGVLPIVSAPTIPSDRLFGVDELLRSLPLSGGIYLAGKVLGVLAVVLLTGAVTLTLHVLLHLALAGPLNPGLYLELTLVAGLPLLLWAPTVGVLAASGLRTRRTAIIMGILTGIAGPPVWALALRPPTGQPSFSVETTSLLSRQAASDFVLGRRGLLPPWVPPVTAGEVAQVFAVAFLALFVLAIVARLWLWRKENV